MSHVTAIARPLYCFANSLQETTTRAMSEKSVGLLSQLFPPKPTWTAADVPDQTGKTVIVTGGNSGIGRETARVSPSFAPHRGISLYE